MRLTPQRNRQVKPRWHAQTVMQTVIWTSPDMMQELTSHVDLKPASAAAEKADRRTIMWPRRSYAGTPTPDRPFRRRVSVCQPFASRASLLKWADW
jgi:hypothetical protein